MSLWRCRDFLQRAQRVKIDARAVCARYFHLGDGDVAGINHIDAVYFAKVAFGRAVEVVAGVSDGEVFDFELVLRVDNDACSRADIEFVAVAAVDAVVGVALAGVEADGGGFAAVFAAFGVHAFAKQGGYAVVAAVECDGGGDVDVSFQIKGDFFAAGG